MIRRTGFYLAWPPACAAVLSLPLGDGHHIDPIVVPPPQAGPPMDQLPSQSLLEELDACQDELLAELEHLNRRIEQTIQETLAWRGAEAEQARQEAA